MNTEGIAAYVRAALISFLLLTYPLSAPAEETSQATLIGIEPIESGDYSHRARIQLDNRTEQLLLSPYQPLNQLAVVDTNGIPQTSTAIAYRGIVEALPLSRAELVIDGNFIAGTITTHGQILQLASDSGGIEPTIRAADRVIYPPPVAHQRTALSNRHQSPDQTAPIGEEIVIPTTSRFTDALQQVNRVATIGIVIDSLYDEAIGGRGLSKAISTINSVDALYREKFGLALKVEQVVLVTDNETISLNGDNLEDNLGLFRDYRIGTELLPPDLAFVHLFTGLSTTDDAIGLAYSGAACRTDGYDVSMSRPFRFPVVLTAHEIGHNLGAIHDDDTTDCADIHNQLMFSEITSNTLQEFSSCSTNAISTRLQQSACYTAAINIGLNITRLESNQILATVSNHDASRAFPAASLRLDLENATIAEAPASCTLENPTLLTCAVPATYAGDTQEIAIKLRLDPDEERTLTAHLEPNGFFDLIEEDNFVEMIIPGDPQPLASTGGEVTTQGNGGSDNVDNTVRVGGSGGGSFDYPAVWQLVVMLLAGTRLRRRSTTD